MKQLLSQTLKLATKLTGWGFTKGWLEPQEIRGPVWTTAFWVFLACSVYLTAILFRSGKEVLTPLLLQGLAYWVMRREDKKPKKLGRPLPYRRRR